MVGEKILVVDDEDSIREIVCSMLNAAGYQCKQASSGVDALGVLATGEDFALMLSDLMMRDLDGIGLLEQTKIKFPEMPVIMVTAVHDISVALAAIRNGVAFSRNGVTITPVDASGDLVWKPTVTDLAAMGYLPTGWTATVSSLNAAPYTIAFARVPAGCAPYPRPAGSPA